MNEFEEVIKGNMVVNLIIVINYGGCDEVVCVM